MNINALMQQAQKMKNQMEKKQREIEAKEFEVSSNGGAIKIKMLGSKQLTGLEIAKDLIDPEDKEMLEDMLKIAINDAIVLIDKEQDKIQQKMASSMGMPRF